MKYIRIISGLMPTFTFIILCSCGDQSNKASSSVSLSTREAVHHIDLTNIDDYRDKTVDLREFFPSMSYIRLETVSDALIGRVDKVLFEKDRIFIADYKLSKTVFIFNLEGKFLSKIANRGKGPGEHISIYDITLDKDEKALCLHDLDARKVNYYDYGGKFLFSKTVPFLFSRFEWLDKNSFLTENDASNKSSLEKTGRYHVIKTSLDGDIEFKALEYEPNYDVFSYYDQYVGLMKKGESIYFRPRWCPVIYKFESDSLFPYYHLDFGKKGISYDWILQITDSEHDKLIEKLNTLPSFHGSFAETNDLAIFNVRFSDNRNGYLFYSKETSEAKIYGKNDILGIYDLVFKAPLYSSNEGIATIATSDKLFELANFGYEDDTPAKKNPALYKDLEPGDNPVIFLYKR